MKIISIFSCFLLSFFLFTSCSEGDKQVIERTWLLKSDFDHSIVDGINPSIIEQSYLNFSPEVRIRNIDHGNSYVMTTKVIKDNDGAKVFEEKHYEITREEYEILLKKIVGNTVVKETYRLKSKEGYPIKIDVFKGELVGLVYLEVSFPNKNKAKAYKHTVEYIKEITNDAKYKNASLAEFGVPVE